MISGLNSRGTYDPHDLPPKEEYEASDQHKHRRCGGVNGLDTTTSGKHLRFVTDNNASDKRFVTPGAENSRDVDDAKPELSANKSKEYRRPSVVYSTA
jgi:hypothetical protein